MENNGKFAKNVLAHRGVWKQKSEQNTMQSFIDSLNNGWGIETDIRFTNGELVISHDHPKGEVVTFRQFIETLSVHESFQKVYYALNIKEDGLQDLLMDVLNEFHISERCFVFDMSGPDQIVFERKRKKRESKLMVCARLSEHETPIMYENCEAIWMDAFESNWIQEEDIRKHLNKGKLVAMVSPELHKREGHMQQWKIYKKLLLEDKNLLVCTDYPFEFMEFMGE